MLDTRTTAAAAAHARASHGQPGWVRTGDGVAAGEVEVAQAAQAAHLQADAGDVAVAAGQLQVAQPAGGGAQGWVTT